MGSSRSLAVLAAFATLVAFSRADVARANPEPTSTYDARVAGMAGTAVGYIDNATAIFHNPAGLGNIRKYSVSLVTDLLVVRYNVPFAGPGSEINSPPIIAPLPFVGGAYRLTKRLVLGAGVYVTTGFGGRFTDIPRLDDYTPRTPSLCSNAPIGSTCSAPPNDVVTQTTDSQTVTLYVLEGNVSAGVNVLDNLRLGLSLRVPYTSQSATAIEETFPAVPSSSWQHVSQSVSGFGWPAILFGLQWDVTRWMTLAAVYRSPTTSHMSGQTRTSLSDGQDPIVVSAKSEWHTPNMIRFGASFHALHNRLLVNLEVRAQFHKSANHDQHFDLCYPNCETSILPLVGADRITAPFEWRNVVYPSLGAEYRIARNMWWRFGTSAGRSATPAATVSPFSPPPVWQYNLATGFGVAFGPVRIDMAYALGVGPSAHITQRNSINCSPVAQQKSGCDGTYSLDSHTFALSASVTR